MKTTGEIEIYGTPESWEFENIVNENHTIFIFNLFYHGGLLLGGITC